MQSAKVSEKYNNHFYIFIIDWNKKMSDFQSLETTYLFNLFFPLKKHYKISSASEFCSGK